MGIFKIESGDFAAVNNEQNFFKRCVGKFGLGVRAAPSDFAISLIIGFTVRQIAVRFAPGAAAHFGSVQASSFFCTVIETPVVEEILFRGILQPGLTGAFHNLMGREPENEEHAKWMGIALSAGYFGACHGEIGQIAYAAAGGVYFGLARNHTVKKYQTPPDASRMERAKSGILNFWGTNIECLLMPLGAHMGFNLLGYSIPKLVIFLP